MPYAIHFLSEPDNKEEEYILLQHRNFINFVKSETAKVTKETASANHLTRLLLSKLKEKEGKNVKMSKMVLKAGFTAGVMNQHFVNGDVKKGCEYYDKYVEVLSECDEFLSENFPDGTYLDVINSLNDDRKSYEKLKILNQKKEVVERAMNHFMTNIVHKDDTIFLD